MNKHDYLVDNVNSKSPVDRDHEVRSTQMCSYQQDESTENCSFQQCGACGDGCGTTTERYLEVLEFSHFVTMFEYDGNSENYKNKHLIDRINVSVVLDLGCGNTKYCWFP